MAAFTKKSNGTALTERETNDAGLIEEMEAPFPISEFNCRDLGPKQTTNSMTDGLAEHQNKLSRIISGLDENDAKVRYEVERADNRISLPNSAASSINTPEQKKVIHWEDGDKENPYNWSSVRSNYLLNTLG
jgi:hypothetical protein